METAEKINKKEDKAKKERGNFRINSIGSKLSFVIIIMLVLSLTTVGYLNYQNSYQALKSEIEVQSGQTIEFVDLSMDNYLEGIEKQAIVLAMNSLLVDSYSSPED